MACCDLESYELKGACFTGSFCFRSGEFMTKRDVALWFCNVLSYIGLVQGVFYLLPLLGSVFGLRNYTSLNSGVIFLAFFFFVRLFSEGLATELAAEGERGGELITSVRELTPLMWRCVGLGIAFNGALSLPILLGSYGITMFVGGFRDPLSLTSFYGPAALSYFVEAALGLMLAFGPRVRVALRSR